MITPDKPRAAGAAPPSAGGTVLVAYYSAQGHTKAVAETIAGELGASVFVIESADPFSGDDLNWRNDSSRVVTEYENPDQRSTRLAANAPADFAGYDTVFIGYPIWWQSASWAMTDFARQNDFTGKTVIPFCTSTSSPLGSSGSELEQLTGTETWQEGMRFAENASTEEVAQWAAPAPCRPRAGGSSQRGAELPAPGPGDFESSADVTVGESASHRATTCFTHESEGGDA